MSWIISVIAGLIAVGFLMLVFSVVRSGWPQSYYAVGDLTSFRISQRPARYILFRFVPVALVSFVTVTLVRTLNGNALAAAAVVAVGHTVTTTARASINLLRRPSGFGRRVQFLMNSFVTIGIVLAVVVAVPLSALSGASRLVPSATEIPVALWTAAFAAFGGAFLVQVARSQTPSIEQLMKRSRETLPPSAWEEAERAALAYDADPSLVKAVLLVENLQRPRWVRRLESIKGKIFSVGSYGVMQVRAAAPITDLDSIEIAVRERLRDCEVATAYDKRDQSLEQILRSYNDDKRFVELGKAFYTELAGPPEYEERWFDEVLEELSFVVLPSAVGFLTGGLTVAVVLFIRRGRAR